MQECVHVTGSRPFSLVFNNTTNLATHTCLCLKCCEAKQLVNHSVAESKKWGGGISLKRNLSSLMVLSSWLFLYCRIVLSLILSKILPPLPSPICSAFCSPSLKSLPADHHAPTSLHEQSHYNGPVCKCERHWCHIESIQIHPHEIRTIFV